MDKDERKGSKSELMHASFTVNKHAVLKRLDFDEYNSVLSLQSSYPLEIVQVPLAHRNTKHFIGMAERSYYLAFKRHENVLYALDKSKQINKWCCLTGELLGKQHLGKNQDYSGFQIDRELYDRDWFPYTLVYKDAEDGSETRINKLLKLDEHGKLSERLSFSHAAPRNQTQHLYFNTKLDRMIELLIPKGKGGAS